MLATDHKLAGRRMLGTEALVARLLTPTGLSEALQLVYLEANGWYTAHLGLTAAGPNIVSVMLDHEPVVNSPFTVQVRPLYKIIINMFNRN